MAFSYYKSVTADHTQCGGSNSTNFPITIYVTDPDFKTVGNGGFVQNVNGYDIRPYSDTGLTTPITGFQLVRGTYDPTTGTFEMHVLVPTLSFTVNTVFYLAFGDASITTDGSSATTWTNNFQGVYHCEDISVLGIIADSSGNGASGTINGSITAGSGVVDGAAVSAGSAYADMGNNVHLGITGPITVSCWAFRTSDAGGQMTMASKGFDGTNTQYQFFMDNTQSYKVGFITYDGSIHGAFSAAASVLNTWEHWAGTFDGSVWKVYKNGSLSGTSTDSQAPIATARHFQMFAVDVNGTADGFFVSGIDELRVANVARSADWILQEYNNQIIGSTFLSFGSKVPVGGSPVFSRLSILGVG